MYVSYQSCEFVLRSPQICASWEVSRPWLATLVLSTLSLGHDLFLLLVRPPLPVHAWLLVPQFGKQIHN